MNAYIDLFVLFFSVVFITKGKATPIFSFCSGVALYIFHFPSSLHNLYKERKSEREALATHICPNCGKELIREDESICKHCKLEISLGLYTDEK